MYFEFEDLGGEVENVREDIRIGDLGVRVVRREEDEDCRIEDKEVIIVIFRDIVKAGGCEACVLHAATAVLRKGDAMLTALLSEVRRAMAKPGGSRINWREY